MTYKETTNKERICLQEEKDFAKKWQLTSVKKDSEKTDIRKNNCFNFK